ncbi:uncharacterized protein LOC115878932 isoform X2 [Sitophilus oryzae]|uniref:Uncharacterized protein LOC115878932 isoform X2 n=1 Tax=Sitophilus oryzae TaxID=7048 RepID=A0A6J2XJX8_SITOR|nr:uncharacterized protein LOC115878932 isoform X2 [Sitophilus oryzae]
MSSNKWCFVPGCINTSKNNPQKIFISVPRNVLKKKKWFAAARRELKDVSLKTIFFCCEDHFNLTEDMENYYEYKLSKVQARMKPDVVPHIFACQTDKKSNNPRISSEIRSRKRKISEILIDSEMNLSENVIDDSPNIITQPSTSFHSTEETKNSSDKISFSCQANPVKYRSVQGSLPVKNISTSPIKFAVPELPVIPGSKKSRLVRFNSDEGSASEINFGASGSSASLVSSHSSDNFNLSDAFNIKFVGEVEKYPELYDFNLPEYSRKDYIEKAWSEIAQKVKMKRECKEKWRNLRSTLAKNLKPKPGSGGRKKLYYLKEAMQFAVPFIKISGTTTGNAPQLPEEQPGTSSRHFMTDISELDVSQETSVFSELYEQAYARDPLSSPNCSLPTSSRPPLPTLQTTLPSAMSGDCEGPPRRVPRARKRTSQISPSDKADKAIAEYFAIKTQQIVAKNLSTDYKKEGIQNFLNSLIPDLMQFDDAQLRVYKRRALLLIDEVAITSPGLFETPAHIPSQNMN